MDLFINHYYYYYCHIAFCRSNKVDLSKLNAPIAFTRASYRNIKSYFTSIELRKSQIKESGYLTQESSLRIYYSSWFVEYPLHPIACCFPHLRCSRRFFIFPIQHLRCSSGHHSHHLTIGSYVSVRSSRYETREKFGERERCVTVARGVAESNSSFLSALQTCQVLHISMNTQLTYEPIVL